MLLVKTPACKPYTLSLTISTASSNLSKGSTVTTGPNISMQDIFMVLFVLHKIVGS